MYINETNTKPTKITIEMLEEKVKQFPYFNPKKRDKLNFGQYIEVIETERKELLKMFNQYKIQTQEEDSGGE